MNYLFGTENSGGKRKGTFLVKSIFLSCVLKQGLIVVFLVVIKLIREIKGVQASACC